MNSSKYYSKFFKNINSLFVHILLLYNTFFVSFIETYSCNLTPNELKFDCIPKGKSDQLMCEQLKCCWTPANQSSTQWPWCYYPECYNNYHRINVSNTSTGIEAFYNLTKSSNYKKNIQNLRLDIIYETSHRLRVTVCFVYYIILTKK